MNISARIVNLKANHSVTVTTDGREQSVLIPPNAEGFESGLNGGELLFAALGTCYCNDIYREARKRGIEVVQVDVEVSGRFGSEGQPAQEIMCRAV